MAIAILPQTTPVSDRYFWAWLSRDGQISRWARPGQDSQGAENHAFGRWVERQAAEIVSLRGWPTAMTTHRAAFDLWAGGARLEIKAAHWDGHRYQAHIRPGQAAACDLLLLACCGHGCIVGWFVIPSAEIGDIVNLAITSGPARYTGRWSTWFERWELVDCAARRGVYPAQLALFEYGC